MKLSTILVVFVLVLTMSLSGCTATKQAQGTAVGTVLGGAAGALFGSGSGKIVAVIAGAAIGGLIGNQLGAMLDDEDKKALQAQSNAVLQQQDGDRSTWSSTHSDASAVIVPTNTRVESREVAIVRDASVAPAPQMDIISALYGVKRETQVRLAPSENAEVATTLSAKSSVWAVGKVRGTSWIMVARKGKSIGYVQEADIYLQKPVKKAGSEQAAKAPSAKSAPSDSSVKKEQAASTDVSSAAMSASVDAYDLDAEGPVRTPVDLDALGPDTQKDILVAEVSCRDLQTSVTAKGETRTSTSTACKTPDGSWAFE